MKTPSSAFPRRSLAVTGGFAACLLALTACQRQESPVAASAPAAATPPPAAKAAATKAAAPGSAVAADVARVRGRWLRPDGGYILAFNSIDADGRAEAGYFNPSPIRVAWARVKPEGTAIKVDVELRDQNYPGCLYKLTYLPDRDRLVGTYFQAQMQQTYEVEFVREP